MVLSFTTTHNKIQSRIKAWTAGLFFAILTAVSKTFLFHRNIAILHEEAILPEEVKKSMV